MGEAGHRGNHGAVSRRVLLTGLLAGGTAAATGVAVERGVLPGRSRLVRAFGSDGPDVPLPDEPTGRVVSGVFSSQARLGHDCGWSLAYPPGSAPGDRLPVLIVLHGRGGDHTSAFGSHLGLDRFLARAVRQGVAPFAIASVDGGDTYWHPRDTGEDAGAMVVEEFLPLLQRRGLDTARIGLTGWSMGGYGSLHLAGLLGARRVPVVAAASPALHEQAADAATGAFDDAEDFAEHTVFGRQEELVGVALRIDCGTADPFYAATKAYVQTLSPAPAGGFQSGGHDVDYWRSLATDQLAFIGAHLAA